MKQRINFSIAFHRSAALLRRVAVLLGAAMPRVVGVGLLGVLLSACGGGGGSAASGAASGAGAPSGTPTTPSTTLTNISGSVGDGPISGARVTASDSANHVVAEATSDALAHYQLGIPSDAKYPLTIKATGGTDLVTGRAPDFDLTSVITDATQTTANVTPISSMIVRAANCRSGGLTATNITSARQSVADQLSVGLDALLVPNAITTPVDDTNVAAVVKANQVMAEILTRTTSTLQHKGRTLTVPQVIEALACDLSDGELDGSAASGGISEVSTIAQAAIANVLTEAISNQLQVGGENAHDAIDTVVHRVAPNAPASVNTDAVQITPQVVAETRKALVTSLPLQADDATLALVTALEGVNQPVSAAALTQTLPADATTKSAQLLIAAQSAPTASIAAATAQLKPGATTTPSTGIPRTARPTLTLTADAAEVASGGTTTVRWATTNVASCVGVKGFTGTLPANGTRVTPPITRATTFSLTCLSTSSSVTASVTVNLPVPTVTITADQTTLNRNERTTLRWSSNRVTSCTASGAWTGTRAGGGTELVGPIIKDSPFTITCTDGARAVAQTVTVRIAAPILTLTPPRTLVDLGAGVAMNWTSVNTDSCTASGGWTGTKPTTGAVTLPAIAGPTNYTLSCTGPAGSTSKTVTVSPGSPALTLGANVPAVDLGGAVVLSWHASNATGCTASGAWTGAKGVDGPATVTNVRAKGTYTLTCNGTGGSIAKSVDVNVKAPVAVLSADHTSIITGQSVVLNWTSTNATACTAGGAWSGTRATSGTFTTGAVNAPSTFTLQCAGPGGQSAVNSVAITMTSAKPTVTLTASSDIVSANGTVTLTWTSQGGGTCTASGADTRFKGIVAASGSLVSSAITADRTFTLTCTNAAGSATATASVITHGTSISWTAPSQLNDGSKVGTVRGFNIYYGRSSGNYDKVFHVFDGAATHQIVPLGTGTWFVTVTALTDVATDTEDTDVTEVRESNYSNEVQKVVQ